MRRMSTGLALVAVLAVASCGAGDDTAAPTAPETMAAERETSTAAPETAEPSPRETPMPTPTEPPEPSPKPTGSEDRADRVEPTPIVTPPTAAAPQVGEVPPDYLDPVVADAADRAGVPIGEVTVTRAQAVQWNDGSLGCPEPGMMYIQVIIDGYWVELSAGGAEYDYRLDNHGRYTLCEQPDRRPPIGTDR